MYNNQPVKYFTFRYFTSSISVHSSPGLATKSLGLSVSSTESSKRLSDLAKQTPKIIKRILYKNISNEIRKHEVRN
jgi:hypothetical protein